MEVKRLRILALELFETINELNSLLWKNDLIREKEHIDIKWFRY